MASPSKPLYCVFGHATGASVNRALLRTTSGISRLLRVSTPASLVRLAAPDEPPRELDGSGDRVEELGDGVRTPEVGRGELQHEEAVAVGPRDAIADAYGGGLLLLAPQDVPQLLSDGHPRGDRADLASRVRHPEPLGDIGFRPDGGRRNLRLRVEVRPVDVATDE